MIQKANTLDNDDDEMRSMDAQYEISGDDICIQRIFMTTYVTTELL